MTLLGIWLCGPNLGYAWSDSLIYLSGRPCGHANKMAVNGTANIVAVLAGPTDLMEPVTREVQQALSLDDLLASLPTAMRDVRPPELSRAAGTNAGHALAIGWSHRFNRLVGYQFDSWDDFTPMMANQLTVPYVHDFEHFYPEIETPDAIIQYALRQMVEMKKTLPRAGAGVLTVAKIQPDGVSVRTLYDFGTGQPLSRPKNFYDVAGEESDSPDSDTLPGENSSE